MNPVNTSPNYYRIEARCPNELAFLAANAVGIKNTRPITPVFYLEMCAIS